MRARPDVSTKRLVVRRALLGLVLIAVSGCDPLFTMQFRQSLAPRPEENCLAAALRASPLAAVVWPDSTHRGRYIVTVRDSLWPGGAWQVHVDQGGARDSTWVDASYSYMGYATPPRAVRARWAGQARDILDTVRVRCSPAVPLDVHCRNIGFIGGQRGACVAPA